MQIIETFKNLDTLSPLGEIFQMPKIGDARTLAELVLILKEEAGSFDELAKRAELGKGTVIRISQGHIPSDTEVFRKLALFSGLGVDRVFELAGLIAPNSPYSPVAREIAGLVDRLPDDKKADAVAMIRAIWERHQQANKP